MDLQFHYSTEHCSYNDCVYCNMPKINCGVCNNTSPEKEMCFHCFGCGFVKEFDFRHENNTTTYYTTKEKAFKIFETMQLNKDNTKKTVVMEYGKIINKINDLKIEYNSLKTEIENYKKLLNTINVNCLVQFAKKIISTVVDSGNITNFDNIGLEINDETINKIAEYRRFYSSKEAHDELESKKQEYLQKIKQNVQKMSEIENEVLLFDKQYNILKTNIKKINKEIQNQFTIITNNIIDFISKNPINNDYICKISRYLPQGNGYDIPCYWKNYIISLISEKTTYIFYTKFINNPLHGNNTLMTTLQINDLKQSNDEKVKRIRYV